jgi:hypothetical protein
MKNDGNVGWFYEMLKNLWSEYVIIGKSMF